MRCGGVKGMKLSTQKIENVEKQASTVNKTAIAAGPGLAAALYLFPMVCLLNLLIIFPCRVACKVLTFSLRVFQFAPQIHFR
jgi:hypothetical protein